MRALSIFTAAACLLLAAPAAAKTRKAAKTKEPAKMSAQDLAAETGPAEWKGQSCAVSSPKAVVVERPEEWERLWRKSVGGEPPEADLAKHFAVAVFVGMKNTGGYSVEFLEPRIEAGRAVIPYRVKKPGKGAFVIQAFTSPYAVKLFKKTPLKVAVRESP